MADVLSATASRFGVRGKGELREGSVVVAMIYIYMGHRHRGFTELLIVATAMMFVPVALLLANPKLTPKF